MKDLYSLLFQALLFVFGFGSQFIFSFIICPPGGYKLCSSSDVTYSINAVSVGMNISDCVYENCPQIQISDSVNINFNNVTFKNGNYSGNSLKVGGAIFIQGSRSLVTISNSTFSNAAVVTQGSAIYATAGSVLVNNCVFTGNQATDQGGAIMIYQVHAFNCTGCQFYNNIAPFGGAVSIFNGLVTNLPTVYFMDSIFDGNQARSTNGTASGGSISLLNGAKLFISGARFVNGYAESGGGAIYLHGRSSVWAEYCYATKLKTLTGAFISSYGDAGNNNVIVKYSIMDTLICGVAGGAFIFWGGAAYATIESTIFLSSYSQSGSSVFANNVLINVPINFKNCSFFDDYSYWGGAIFGRTATFNIDSCSFYNSFGAEIGGAVVTWDSAAVTYITNSKFYNCRTNIEGGAIGCTAGNLVVNNCYFERCSSPDGGAILARTSISYVHITSNVFVNNKGRVGGDIHIDTSTNGIISDNQFINSYAVNGGSIYTAVLTTMNNNTFYNVVANQVGGAIYASSQYAVTISGCQFFNASAIKGGAGYFESVTLTLQNSNFTGCKSRRSGGAIALYQGTATLINLTSFGSRTNSGGFLVAEYQTLTMSNVFVSDTSSAQLGGIMTCSSSSVYLENCEFRSPTSASGGTFYLTLNSQLTAFSVKVIGSASVFGAVFYLDILSSANCVSSSFVNSISNSNGTLVYATQGCSASFADSLCYSEVPETTSGSLFFLQGATLIVDNFDYEYGTSLSGTFLDAIEGSNANFQGLNLSFITALEKGASIITADGASILQFTNCQFNHPKAEVMFLVTGSSQLTFRLSVLNFNDTPPIALPLWSSTINQILFQSDDNSLIYLSDSSKVLGFIGNTVSLCDAYATFACENSEISYSSVLNAPVFGEALSTIALSNCRLHSNNVLGSVDFCNSALGVRGFGGAVASSGQVSIYDSSEIIGNSADYGGAVAILDPGTLQIGSGVIIKDNSANIYGGAFYIDTSGYCEIDGSNVTVVNNNAPSYPSSSFALFNGGYLGFNLSQAVRDSGTTYSGGILVLNHTTAEVISAGNAVPSSMKLEGRAKVLSLLNFVNGSTIQLTMSKDIPPIQVSVLDGFNKPAIVDPNNLVVVNTVEVGQNATLKGETVKTVLDPTLRMTTLYSLSISNRVEGFYRLKITGKDGTLDNSDIGEMPLILNIQYRSCIEGVEFYVDSENACLTLSKISPIIRVFLIAVCLFLIVGCMFTLYGLFVFRNAHLIKANSYVFLSIPVFGCILAFLSPVVASYSCILSTGLENIGFCLIFSSLLIKLYRIRILFGGSHEVILRQSTIESLKEKNLIRYLLAGVAVFLAYEVAWGILDNPMPRPTYIPSMGIVISDECHLNSFLSFGMAAIKFVTSVIVSYLAFINRNVPSDFNEAKYIGFSCYNWVIFGTFISLTSQFIITNPNVAFLVKGFSLIMSHAYTTLYLASYKVYKCWSKPAETQTRKKVNMTSSLVPSVPGATVTKSMGSEQSKRSESVKSSQD